jgi:RNA polymerase sigma factor (sigma-70 family)
VTVARTGEKIVSQGDPFADLMARLRRGDDTAATEVFKRFADRLVALARSQFDTWLRHRAEPEDVVQSVYRSFFTRYREGQFDLTDWDSLWGLLAVITLRKCANRAHYLQADRRAIQRETPLQTADDSATSADLPARDPTPSEAAVLTETLEQLVRGLSERDRAVLELHLQGCEVAEISASVGRSQRTVRRTLERIRQELCAEAGSEPG